MSKLINNIVFYQSPPEQNYLLGTRVQESLTTVVILRFHPQLGLSGSWYGIET